MTVNKKILVKLSGKIVLASLSAITLSLFILSYILTASGNVIAADESRILYHSPDCSSCQSLLSYMNEKDIPSLLSIELRDSNVYADSYETDFTTCYPDSQIRSVPLLLYDGECFTSSTKIQQFLDSKLTPEIETEQAIQGDLATTQVEPQVNNNDISTFDIVIILAVIAFFAAFGYVMLFRFRL